MEGLDIEEFAEQRWRREKWPVWPVGTRKSVGNFLNIWAWSPYRRLRPNNNSFGHDHCSLRNMHHMGVQKGQNRVIDYGCPQKERGAISFSFGSVSVPLTTIFVGFQSLVDEFIPWIQGNKLLRLDLVIRHHFFFLGGNDLVCRRPAFW